MNHLLLGNGQIGKAVQSLLKPDHVYIVDKKYAAPIIDGDIEILHVCIPYSETFIEDVEKCLDKYKPGHTVVYSTVPIGTCEKIADWVVHSPIEGRHPNLAESVKIMERWIGCFDDMERDYFEEFFQVKGLDTVVLGESKYTEALKLLSTAEYGVNLVFADYKAKVVADLGLGYNYVMDWNDEYNRLYKKIDKTKSFQKFVLRAPDGFIGGHCVVPNAEILNEQYPNEALEAIIKMGQSK